LEVCGEIENFMCLLASRRLYDVLVLVFRWFLEGFWVHVSLKMVIKAVTGARVVLLLYLRPLVFCNQGFHRRFKVINPENLFRQDIIHPFKKLRVILLLRPLPK